MKIKNVESRVRSLTRLIGKLILPEDVSRTPLFRGENFEVSEDSGKKDPIPVCSSLSRCLGPGAIGIKAAESDYAKTTMHYLPNDTTLERLAKLQHLGCPTNLLDFTSSLMIGLFFACHNSEKFETPKEQMSQRISRLIILQHCGPSTIHIPSGKEVKIDGDLSLYRPCNQPRVAAQHSIFVRPADGRLSTANYIRWNKTERKYEITNNSNEKKEWFWTILPICDNDALLKELRELYDIREETVYNDFVGLVDRYKSIHSVSNRLKDIITQDSITDSSYNVEQSKQVNRIVNRFSGNMLVYFSAAFAFADQKQYKKAYDYLGLAISQDPQRADPYFWRGYIKKEEAEEKKSTPLMREAEKDLARSVELNSEEPLSLVTLAECRIKLDDLEQVEPILNKAIALDPENPDAHVNFGFYWMALFKKEPAVLAFECAIALNPQLPQKVRDALQQCKDMESGEEKTFDA